MTGQLSGRLFAFRLPSVMSLLGLSFLSAFSFSSFYPSSSSLLLASAQLEILLPISLRLLYQHNNAADSATNLYTNTKDDGYLNTLSVSTTSFGNDSLFKGLHSPYIHLAAYYVPDASPHCHSDYCRTIKEQAPPLRNLGSPQFASLDAKTLVVVDRGQCSFAHKADIAQVHCGASAVIVVDNQPISGDNKVHRQNIRSRNVTGKERRDKTLRVPTILLSAADGETLKAAIAEGVVSFYLGPAIFHPEWVKDPTTPRTDCTE
eukprot:GHVS01068514.1.p1 GENE.GHVS01068514.1~~GHVS01068514.1.p1  ORF type:complete len:276 (+),score=30.92 GHVS01068514.1:45-830(+)